MNQIDATEPTDNSTVAIDSATKPAGNARLLRMVHSFLQIVYGTAFLGMLLVFVATLFASQSYYAELLSHFRVQYMCVGLVMLAGARWFANRPVMWATLLLTLPHVIQVAPFYGSTDWMFATKSVTTPTVSGSPTSIEAIEVSTSAARKVDSSKPLKIVSFNVFVRNHDYNTTIKYLRDSDADIIGIIECSRAWEYSLREGLKDLYPYDSRQELPGWNGNHIFSRIPITAGYEDADFSKIVGADKLMAVKAHWQGQPFIFAAVHPASPDKYESLAVRNKELDLISSVAQANATGRDYPIVFAGDFNCTSGSPFFTRLLAESGLVDTRMGFGLQASWPTFAPAISIPIDHVLTSKHWKTKYREIGPNLGSDHLPVYIELEFAK